IQGSESTFYSLPSIYATQTNSASPSSCASKDEPSITASQCRDRIMKYELGLDNGTPYKRKTKLGPIVHSTPTVVSRPSEYLRDETYNKFQAKYSTRPLMLYTATTDGMLHE